MLHAGLDLSRRKIDICLLSEAGDLIDQLVTAPDADALRTLARRIDAVYGEPVCAVIESMTGARLVHDTLGLDACSRDGDRGPWETNGAAGLGPRRGPRLPRARSTLVTG